MLRWIDHQWFSFALTLWGMLVFWVVGNRKRHGWILGLLGQVAWVGYAFWLKQWGLLLGSVFYTSVYYRNWRKWKIDESLG